MLCTVKQFLLASCLILLPFQRYKTAVLNIQNASGDSPVHADHAQGHDGGRAAHYIHPDEYVAEHLSKKPFAPGEIGDYHKGHHNYSH